MSGPPRWPVEWTFPCSLICLRERALASFRHFADRWSDWLHGDFRADRACRARRLDGSRLRHHSACARFGLLRRFRADPERPARVADTFSKVSLDKSEGIVKKEISWAVR